MRPRSPLTRIVLGLAAFAGLALLGPAPAARAQFTYGYDSITSYPPAQAYWYGAGYSPIYNDPSTGIYANGTIVPPRGVAPYSQPPFGQIGANNGLNVYARPALNPVTVAPLRPMAVQRRRGLFGRLRAR
jgi:hypothetical protein